MRADDRPVEEPPVLIPRRPLVARRLSAALLLAAAVPLAAATATTVRKAGRWQLHADRHRITLSPRPRRSCPGCRGAGGRWVSGATPEMEACPCWSDRRELRNPLLPLPTRPDEPPF